MKIGRYSCKKVTIPAPEIPPKISKGGSQHQLDAMKAESKAPKLAKRSPRPRETSPPSFLSLVAPGDWGLFDAQQSAAGAKPSFNFSGVAANVFISVAPGN